MDDEKKTRILEEGDHFGDYTVVKLLGKGGMGAVYLMRGTSGSEYAVKIMFPDKVTHDMRRRFAKEAEFAIKIRHRNLVSVYDVGEDPETGLCYMIMDYVPGGSLADLLERRGRIPLDEAVSITAQIAAALEVAHKHGLVHRDIKPDNILFDADGTPRLADLGVAKFDDAQKSMVTTTGMVIGTPAYMAPEQMLNSHAIDARADIYALGVVLYEMLSGKRPNEGRTAIELMAKALKGEPLPDIRTLCPELAASVAHVVSLLCAPKPEARPQTALAAADLLRKAASGKLVLVRKRPSATAADEVARRDRRKRLLKFAAASVGIVAVIAAGTLAVRGILSRNGLNGVNVGEVAPKSYEDALCGKLDAGSYVQDGLVAMWDGIENAGRNKHDPKAKVWKNLAGAPDAVPADGLAVWSDNAALLGAGHYYLVDSLFGKPQSVTVEVCHHAMPITKSGFSALFSSCQDGGIGLQCDKGSRWLVSIGKPTGGYYSQIHLSAWRDKAETLAFSVGDAFTVYRDAKAFGLVPEIKGIRYNEGHVFQIGRDPGDGDDLVGEVYSIRLYSRPLSAEEIRRNHEVDRVRFGLDRVAPAGVPPAAAGNTRKTTVLIPRLDRNPKAWAYSFDAEPGWHGPDFDDSGWKRAEGGFGAREKHGQLRFAFLNTRWDAKRIFLRRRFNWPGGDVSRVVADIFHDGDVNIYLNGKPVFSTCGSNTDWMPHEIPATCFASAMNTGDNVFCVEVVKGAGCRYFDCGLVVESGGAIVPHAGPDGMRKIKSDVGTWTVVVQDGVAQIGDGRNVALEPRPKGHLRIPSELDGLAITRLAQDCFIRCGELKSVGVSEGVRSIGQGAFWGCSQLSDVQLPTTLEHVGPWAFLGTWLRVIDLREVRLMGGGVFNFCERLDRVTVNPENPTFAFKDGLLYDNIRRAVVFCPRKNIACEIPVGTEYIYDSAFRQCKVKNIEIPATVKAIGDCAFEACPNLESVKFRGDDVILYNRAFGNLPSLKTISLPLRMRDLGAWAVFSHAGRLESVTLPDTVETIGPGVFEDCPELKRIYLGTSLRSVKWRAFAGSRKLAEIDFPRTLREITTETFMGCQSLKRVSFAGNAPSLVGYENRSGRNIYRGASKSLVTYVTKGSTGWLDASDKLPKVWPVDGGENACAIAHSTPNGEDGSSYVSRSALHAAYRRRDKRRVFVEIPFDGSGKGFSSPPSTLERLDEAIAAGADIVWLKVRNRKDGVLVAGNVALEELLRRGKGKVLFKMGSTNSERELELLKRLDAWESTILEVWDLDKSRAQLGDDAFNKIRSGELQIMIHPDTAGKWSDVTQEFSVWSRSNDLKKIGLSGVPQHVDAYFGWDPGEAGRTDDETGWDKALSDGVTIFRTKSPKELVNYLKKKGMH